VVHYVTALKTDANISANQLYIQQKKISTEKERKLLYHRKNGRAITTYISFKNFLRMSTL
jgi:hypothetical protein